MTMRNVESRILLYRILTAGTLERSLRSKTGVSGKIADPGISKEAEESPGLRRSLRVRKTPEAHTSISMTRPLTKEKVNVSARKGSSKSKRKRSSVPPSTKSAKSTQTLRLNICKKKKTPVRKLKVKTQWVYVRASDFDQIYQFKIVLLYSKPKIWRRIQVPSIYNFRQLHRAIQAAMGWRGYHMHKFQTYDKTEIGIPCKQDSNTIFVFSVFHYRILDKLTFFSLRSRDSRN